MYNTKNHRVSQVITGIPTLDKQIKAELDRFGVVPRESKTAPALFDELIEDSIQSGRDLMNTINRTIGNFGVNMDRSGIMRNIDTKKLSVNEFMGGK